MSKLTLICYSVQEVQKNYKLKKESEHKVITQDFLYLYIIYLTPSCIIIVYLCISPTPDMLLTLHEQRTQLSNCDGAGSFAVWSAISSWAGVFSFSFPGWVIWYDLPLILHEGEQPRLSGHPALGKFSAEG